MSIRVLHLTLSFSPSGRRNAIEQLSTGLKAFDVHSGLACLDEFGCPHTEIEGLFSHTAELRRRRLWDRNVLHGLIRICREQNIEVIHAHDASGQFMAALVRRHLPRIRALMTFHRSLPFESERIRDRVRNAYATAKCAAVVVGSTERRQHFIESNYVRASKVVRIPFGVDAARFQPNEKARDQVRRELRVGEGDVVLGCVGHFGPVKGVDLVLTAFRKLRTKWPHLPVQLVVCGSGMPNDHRRLEALAGNDERVTFLGFRHDIDRLMQGFDVFVHAPRLEAFGLVLLEAMASGLPVVASKVGGITDIVDPGTTGLLVPPERTDQLVAAVGTLAQDVNLREDMGAAGRRRVIRDYTVGQYIERHWQLYKDILSGRPPQGVTEPEDKA